jgi:excisionase family DNA binding protein
MAEAAETAAGVRYLSWAAAARYTGLSQMTLRRLVATGRLHLLMPMARCPRLDRHELDRLMREGMHGGA